MDEKLMAGLRPALLDGEVIIDETTGQIPVRRAMTSVQDGAVVVTNLRVILITKKIGGHVLQDFSLSMLASVDHNKGLIYGNLDLALAGDHILVRMIPKRDIDRIARTVREGVAAAQSWGGRSGPIAESPAEQVRELARLRDEGLVSHAEFERKRVALLGL